MVRDAISDVIGKLASKVAIGVLTAGLAAPWAVSTAVTEVSSWVTRLSKEVADTVLSARNLKDLLSKANRLFDDVGTAFSRMASQVGESAAKRVDDLARSAQHRIERLGDFLTNPQYALAGAPGISMRRAGDMGKAKPTVYRPSKGPTPPKTPRPNPNEGRWGVKLDDAANTTKSTSKATDAAADGAKSTNNAADAATEATTAAATAKTEVDPKNDRADRGDRRDARGRFTENNGGAHTYADYERQGREVYSQQREEAGKPLQRMVEEQHKAHVEGVEQGRFYDGLAQEADGTWTGIENKHGKASLRPEQREFDQSVSPDNPARVRLDTGEEIEVVRVVYTYE